MRARTTGSLHIDALPETRGPEQHGTTAGAKAPQQLLARRPALHQQGSGRRRRMLERMCRGAQRAMAGEQQEGTSSGGLE
jgi:hypothetical protein